MSPERVDRAASDARGALSIATVREASARSAFLQALRELGREGPGYTLERLLDLVAVVDHFESLLRYGQLEFLRAPLPVTDADRDFALDVQRIFLEAANGLQRFLRNRASWARTRETQALMFRVTGLAMAAIHGFAKWRGFLNEPGGIPWRQMHSLYALAEADGYAQAPFAPHGSLPDYEACARSLYLRTVLLELLDTGNLSRPGIEIADGWLASWCADFSLDRETAPGRHGFLVDLASDRGAQRAARRSGAASMRYLRLDALQGQLEHMRAELRQGRLHAATGAGAAFPIEEHAQVLAAVEKLHRAVVARGEGRLDARVAFEDRDVDVVWGIERVLRKAREAPPEPGDDPDPDIARWRVHDLSSGGYGLLADRAASEAVPLQGLVALRNHESGGWIVGSVARKQPDRASGLVLLGVEVLAYRPIAVELLPEGPASVPGLFLPGADRGGKGDSLLLPLGDFRSGSRFAIRVGASSYQVRLNRILGKGADWISARFEIESKA